MSVKFVLVLAERYKDSPNKGKATIFIIDTNLKELQNINYEDLADEVYALYRSIEGYSRSFYGGVYEVVNEVMDKYAKYSPVVGWIR